MRDKARIFKDADGWNVIRPGYGFNEAEHRLADRQIDALAWLDSTRVDCAGGGTLEIAPSLTDGIFEVPRWSPGLY